MVKMINDLLDQSKTSNFFYLLIGFMVLLSIIFVMGGDEDLPYQLGRIISFIVVILFAYSLLDWTTRVTEKTSEWTEKESLDEDINLRIQDISELLKRASEGKKMSQDILHEKLKKIFFIKLKEIEDLSDNDIRDLVRNPDEFRKVAQDEIIADFILSLEQDSKKRRSRRSNFLSSSKSISQKSYKNKIKEIIKRIDEWEKRYHG